MAAKPIPDGCHSVTPYLVVRDAARAIAFYKHAFGAVELRPLKDQFYGDRSGMVTDPFGHSWTIATHVEDVAPEEMARRAKAAHQ